MTIQNNTARDLMYQWHSGQSSPFYAAASSGLVRSLVALANECSKIDEPDRAKIMAWIQKRQAKNGLMVCIGGTFYYVLPWISRTYFPKVQA